MTETQETHVDMDSEVKLSNVEPELTEAEKEKKEKDKKKFKVPSRQGFFKLVKLGGWKAWSLVSVGTIAAGANGAVPLLFYLILGDIIDTMTLEKDEMREEMNTSALRMFLVAILSGLLNVIQFGFVTPGNQLLNSNMRKSFMNAIVRQEMGFFDAHKTGGLLNNLTEDTTSFADGFGEKFAQFWQFVIQGVAGLILAFVYSWKMSLVVLATAPALLVAIILQGGVTTFFQKKSSAASEEASNVAEEVISSFKTVRSFAGEEKEVERYSKSTRITDRISIYKGTVQGLTIGIIFFVIWGVCALAFWYGGDLVVKEEITIGEMMKVFGMMLFASLGFAQAMGNLQFFAKALSAAASLLDVIDREPRIAFKGGLQPESVEGNITLENIEFTYPTRAGKVLKGITVDIKPGETVALVGSSGSGKSTILSLVERFYDVEQGRILIDGVDIRDLDPMWLHQKVGIVTQEPTLFACTIEENIKYGVEEATLEEVQAVSKAANAQEFIGKLKDGYKTMVGERGVSLSGGQKQRVAIARALLKDPRILLLDEATSALDTESEHLVQEALDRMMEGRTTLVIAHRLSTVKNADRILVIERGNLVEMGKHADLLKIPNGYYAKLASRQMAFGALDESKDNLGEMEGDKSSSVIIEDENENEKQQKNEEEKEEESKDDDDQENNEE